MEVKPVRPAAQEIQKRFFEAIDMLISADKIKSLAAFCNEHGLHRPKYSNLRTLANEGKPGTGYKFIDIDALSYLVKDHNISADWLLTGKDGMFKK